MFGAMFKLGEQKVRPGVYARWYNAGGSSGYEGSLGVAVVILKSNWGAEGEVTTIESPDDIKDKIGSGKGADVVSEAFAGGASIVLVVRVGTGGEKAKAVLQGPEETDGIEILTKYPTSRNFTITVREGLDPTEKELIAYEDGKQIEKFVVKSGSGETEEFASEINENSLYFTATSKGPSLAAVSNAKFTGGKDPVVTAEDYTNAFAAIERKFFDGIAVDTEDVAVQAALQAFVNRKLQEGFRILGVVGESISVPFETRRQNAASFNDFTMIYVGNGFAGRVRNIDGAEAAGRVLGMVVSTSYKTSLTKKPIAGSVGVYGELTASEYNEAVRSGMMVFSLNPDGIAQIDYGINTLVSLKEGEDEGWKKIRRVKTRYELIDRIAYAIAVATSNDVDNNDDGREHIITLGNGIINTMIQEGGLESGEMILDPANPPVGDSAWFKFENLVDLDGIEKVYLAFGFKY